MAAQLWTIENGAAFIHKLAHNPAADTLSPGTLLTRAMFLAAIDQDRVGLIDFGTGDDRYKRDWVDTVRPRYRFHAFHRAAMAHWPALARMVARRVTRPRDFAPTDFAGTDPCLSDGVVADKEPA